MTVMLVFVGNGECGKEIYSYWKGKYFILECGESIVAYKEECDIKNLCQNCKYRS